MKRMLASLALAALPLAAQDARLGIQIGANVPQSDLKDFSNSGIGSTIGANLTVDFGSGHAIRPRVDYGYYSASVGTPLSTSENKVRTFAFGVDLMSFPAERVEDLYMTAGIGYQNTKLESSTPYGDISESKGAFAWSIGGGWQFNRFFGAEVRYTSSHPKFDAGTFKADAVNAAMTFNF